MKKISIPFAVTAIIFLTACTTGPTRFEQVKSSMSNNLNGCLGILTKDSLLMKASAPTHKESVSGKEIWIYEYRDSKISSTTTGTGGILFPYETETKKRDYALTVSISFGPNGIMDDWSYRGNIAYFDHPFQKIKCR